jgi:hypothetical protein
MNYERTWIIRLKVLQVIAILNFVVLIFLLILELKGKPKSKTQQVQYQTSTNKF